MNRIEQIRENIKNATDWYADNGEFVEDIEYLLNELQRVKGAVRLAIKHISGEGEKFSEREKTPVLFQLKEALKEE